MIITGKKLCEILRKCRRDFFTQLVILYIPGPLNWKLLFWSRDLPVSRHFLGIFKVTVANSCHSKCAVNIERREPCGQPYPISALENQSETLLEPPIWKLATHCTNQGCCYDNNQKFCYQPAKNYCPRPRCEAVPLNERINCLPNIIDNDNLSVEECLNLAPECCWDVGDNFCYKKANVVCPSGSGGPKHGGYSSEIDKNKIFIYVNV